MRKPQPKDVPLVLAVLVDRQETARMIRDIHGRQRRYARIFRDTPWKPDQLSEAAWLAMVAVPWLLKEVEEKCQQGDAQSDPGADGIGLAQTAVQFVKAEEAVPFAGTVVPTGNPLAKLLVGLLAKLVRVRFVIAHVESEADSTEAGKAERRVV